MSDKHVHLKMIQLITNRLSQNSFLLKGWSIVLVSALLGLAARGTCATFACLAFFPAVTLWALDGYFLHQERLFRSLYDHVRCLSEDRIDFSMSTSHVRNQVASLLGVVFSKTLLVFHGGVVLTIAMVMVILALRP